MSLDLYRSPLPDYQDTVYRPKRDRGGYAQRLPYTPGNDNGYPEMLGGGAPQLRANRGVGGPYVGDVSPQVAPQVSPLLRRQTMGLESRGPSPQFRNSQDGQARFGAPPAAAMPQQQAPGNGMRYKPGSVEWGRITREYSNAMKNPLTAGEPGYDEWKQHVDSLRGALGYGGAPAPTTQPSAPQAQQPAPRAQPQPPSESYVRRGPNLAPEAPLDPSERQRRVREMYATAAADLDKNPGLGTQPLQAPRTQFTYGTEAARRAVEMGPGQQGRNEAAMRRGEQRRVNTVNDASAAQFAQNQQASQNIGLRSQQFDQGDYSFSKPLPAVGADGLAQAPASTQQQPQTAGAQQRVPQGGQQQLTNFHVNPQTGERIGWNGTSWQKAQ
jgi:hypothetical protein